MWDGDKCITSAALGQKFCQIFFDACASIFLPLSNLLVIVKVMAKARPHIDCQIESKILPSGAYSGTKMTCIIIWNSFDYLLCHGDTNENKFL